MADLKQSGKMLPEIMAYSIIFERSRKRHVLRGFLHIGSSSGKIFFRNTPGNKWQISHRNADNYAIILYGLRLQSACLWLYLVVSASL